MPSPEVVNIFIQVMAGIGVVFLFGLAIFVHELGHFLAARWMGLQIDTFSIGFGPALWKRKVNGIEYRISVIPLGGYVALPQLDPSGMQTMQGDHGEAQDDDGEPPPLNDVAAWRRIVVSVAGPAGNILLATVLAWAIFLTPGASGTAGDAVVGSVATNSPAFAAGLRPGDRIRSVNNNRVANWNEFIVETHLSGDPSNGIEVVVQRETRELTFRIPVIRDEQAGVVTLSGVATRQPCVVGDVMTNSPAALAGLQPYDVIVGVNDVEPSGPAQVTQMIADHGEQALRLKILRGGKPLDVVLTPQFHPDVKRPLIGVIFDGSAAHTPQWMQYKRPLRQIGNDAKGVVRVLRALLAPRTRGEAKRAAGGLSGPLVIVVLLWYQVQSGLIVALAFLRFLCVNLALINLLPLPVLDGGHIVFALWEIVTRRKPHPKVVNALVQVFAVLLIGLMILLVFRDALNLRRIFGRDRETPAAVSTLSEDTDGTHRKNVGE